MQHPSFDQIKDEEIKQVIINEERRQEEVLCLIASENYTSNSVRIAQGSVLTNKYAEGYPGARYYAGCSHVDSAEHLAIERAKKLFKVSYANVQSHSGSQANQAVYLALLKLGDTILSMSLDRGGHLTHGSKVNQAGKLYNIVSYNLTDEGVIDYDDLRNKAKECRPQLIIAGFSAYSRSIDFDIFRQVADEVGAYLLVDMAHFAGMVAVGLYPEMVDKADVITSTTHKTLRGPRGGLILSNDEKIAKKLNKAVFPGMQGGPFMHSIAAKAVAFNEAMSDDFKNYIDRVLNYAKIIADTLLSRGYKIVGGKTENHIVMIDYRDKGVTGHDICEALEQCGIVCNKNMVPNDPHPPQITSGIRLGTPAIATRGLQEKDVLEVANIIADVSDHVGNKEVIQKSKEKVKSITNAYPLSKCLV